jgi:putative iron-regulated protein
MMRRLLLAAGTGLAIAAQGTASAADPGDRAAVVTTYADIAQAMYQDALTGAQQLRAALGALVATPSDTTLEAAHTAWLSATRSSTTGRAG